MQVNLVLNFLHYVSKVLLLFQLRLFLLFFASFILDMLFFFLRLFSLGFEFILGIAIFARRVVAFVGHLAVFLNVIKVKQLAFLDFVQVLLHY